jgi:uncharacterized metal-binding protein YceD (DUF177 family)
MTKIVHHIPIRIAGIADGRHAFTVTAQPAGIGLPEEFSEELVLHVRMDKTHAQIILTVDVTASAVFPCDLCLDPVPVAVRQHFVLMYARDVASARALDDDEVRLIDPSDAFIDIGDDVRDYALLSIPMRRTCGEDQQGNSLCTKPLASVAVEMPEHRTDPRWEKLRTLQTEK